MRWIDKGLETGKFDMSETQFGHREDIMRAILTDADEPRQNEHTTQ